MRLRLPLCPGFDSLPQAGWGREPENNCVKTTPIFSEGTVFALSDKAHIRAIGLRITRLCLEPTSSAETTRFRGR